MSKDDQGCPTGLCMLQMASSIVCISFAASGPLAFHAGNAGRDIDRHKYTKEEAQEALQRPVVKALLDSVQVLQSACCIHGPDWSPCCDPH